MATSVEAVEHLAASAGRSSAMALDLVAEELDPDGPVFLVGREDLDDVAADPERAPVEIDVVALVLDVHELPQELVAVEPSRRPRG